MTEEPEMRILKMEEFLRNGQPCDVFQRVAERLAEERERTPGHYRTVRGTDGFIYTFAPR